MSKNRDGFEPGQLVDSDTAQRIERERSKKAAEPKPAKIRKPQRDDVQDERS